MKPTDKLFEQATPEEIKRARNEYGSDDIEIDNDAGHSVGDDGVWVQAWVWLRGDR